MCCAKLISIGGRRRRRNVDASFSFNNAVRTNDATQFIVEQSWLHLSSCFFQRNAIMNHHQASFNIFSSSARPCFPSFSLIPFWEFSKSSANMFSFTRRQRGRRSWQGKNGRIIRKLWHRHSNNNNTGEKFFSLVSGRKTFKNDIDQNKTNVINFIKQV